MYPGVDMVGLMDIDIEYFFDILATLYRPMPTIELPNFLVRKTKETKEQAAEWSPGAEAFSASHGGGLDGMRHSGDCQLGYPWAWSRKVH